MFGKMRAAPRILLNSLLVRRHRKSAWLKEIVRCQTEIEELPDAHPHYHAKYKREEKKGSSFVDGHIWQYSKTELFSVLDSSGFRVDRFAYSPGLANRHFNLVAVPK